MERQKATILRAEEISARAKGYKQRLNPQSLLRGTSLSQIAGLNVLGLSWAVLPPGKESFAYHAHDVQEEWMFVLSGNAVAVVDGAELAVGPGDFLGFPVPQVPHLLCNRSNADVTYLMGGHKVAMDVLTYPTLERRYLLRSENGRATFYRLPDPEYPFGPDESNASESAK